MHATDVVDPDHGPAGRAQSVHGPDRAPDVDPGAVGRWDAMRAAQLARAARPQRPQDGPAGHPGPQETTPSPDGRPSGPQDGPSTDPRPDHPGPGPSGPQRADHGREPTARELAELADAVRDAGTWTVARYATSLTDVPPRTGYVPSSFVDLTPDPSATRQDGPRSGVCHPRWTGRYCYACPDTTRCTCPCHEPLIAAPPPVRLTWTGPGALAATYRPPSDRQRARMAQEARQAQEAAQRARDAPEDPPAGACGPGCPYVTPCPPGRGPAHCQHPGGAAVPGPHNVDPARPGEDPQGGPQHDGPQHDGPDPAPFVARLMALRDEYRRLRAQDPTGNATSGPRTAQEAAPGPDTPGTPQEAAQEAPRLLAVGDPWARTPFLPYWHPPRTLAEPYQPGRTRLPRPWAPPVPADSDPTQDGPQDSPSDGPRMTFALTRTGRLYAAPIGTPPPWEPRELCAMAPYAEPDDPTDGSGGPWIAVGTLTADVIPLPGPLPEPWPETAGRGTDREPTRTDTTPEN